MPTPVGTPSMAAPSRISATPALVRPDIPYVPPDPGSPTTCGDLPYAGVIMTEYAAHDCWAVRRNDWGDVDAFYLGGRDPDRAEIGVLIVGRIGRTDDDTALHAMPGRHGGLTVTFARWEYACVRAADGTRAVFVVAGKSFVPASNTYRCA